MSICKFKVINTLLNILIYMYNILKSPPKNLIQLRHIARQKKWYPLKMYMYLLVSKYNFQLYNVLNMPYIERNCQQHKTSTRQRNRSIKLIKTTFHITCYP